MRKLFKKSSKRDSKQTPVEEEEKQLGLLFGRELESVLEPNQRVPHAFGTWCEFILEKGLQTQGLFRILPDPRDVETIKEHYDTGKSVDIASCQPHLVAGLIKLYLVSLPEPITSRNRYMRLLETADANEKERVQKIQDIMVTADSLNAGFMKYFMNFLLCVSIAKEQTKMDSWGLALSLGASIMHPPSNSSAGDVPAIARVIQTMIDGSRTIFGPEPSLAKYTPAMAAPSKRKSEPVQRDSVHRPSPAEKTKNDLAARQKVAELAKNLVGLLDEIDRIDSSLVETQAQIRTLGAAMSKPSSQSVDPESVIKRKHEVVLDSLSSRATQEVDKCIRATGALKTNCLKIQSLNLISYFEEVSQNLKSAVVCSTFDMLNALESKIAKSMPPQAAKGEPSLDEKNKISTLVDSCSSQFSAVLSKLSEIAQCLPATGSKLTARQLETLIPLSAVVMVFDKRGGSENLVGIAQSYQTQENEKITRLRGAVSSTISELVVMIGELRKEAVAVVSVPQAMVLGKLTKSLDSVLSLDCGSGTAMQAAESALRDAVTRPQGEKVTVEDPKLPSFRQALARSLYKAENALNGHKKLIEQAGQEVVVAVAKVISAVKKMIMKYNEGAPVMIMITPSIDPRLARVKQVMADVLIQIERDVAAVNIACSCLSLEDTVRIAKVVRLAKQIMEDSKGGDSLLASSVGLSLPKSIKNPGAVVPSHAHPQLGQLREAASAACVSLKSQIGEQKSIFTDTTKIEEAIVYSKRFQNLKRIFNLD